MMLPKLHPELAALRLKEISLKEELHRILYDVFVLEHDTFKELSARYTECFGEAETALQQATLKASEMQRRLELVVIRSRHGKQITPEEMAHINAMVEREFSVYHRSMDSEKRRASEARSAKRHTAEHHQSRSADQVRERQSLYRQLVKVLHPDVTQDVSLFGKFWLLVTDAYERHDLPRLRSIHGAVCSNAVIPYESGEGVSYLEAEQAVHRLEMRVDYERRKYARLLTEEPYRLQSMLADEQARAAHAEQLQRMIERQERIVQAGAEQLRALVGNDWESARTQNPDLKEEFDFQDDFIENTYFSMRA